MDPEALERKRLQEAEAWRLEQLRAGTSSEDNANFQVPMENTQDWLPCNACCRGILAKQVPCDPSCMQRHTFQ